MSNLRAFLQDPDDTDTQRRIAEIARVMSMKPESIVGYTEVVDGTLVYTREGAQTLIRDGKCSLVYPRRDVLNIAGRGSVKRFEPDSQPDLRPIQVHEGDVEWIYSEGTGVPMEGIECTPDGTEHELIELGGVPVSDEVPDGTANDVMEWVGEDKDRAERALSVELKRETPRSTLVNTLSKLLAKLGYQG